MSEFAGRMRGGIPPLPSLPMRTASALPGALGRSALLFVGDYWAGKMPVPTAPRTSLVTSSACSSPCRRQRKSARRNDAKDS
ncbi:hypothetical protein MPC4_330002 [Methylocella tundrae]|uniref:Uncharacterized protein n=1 Tax=Methylocella tundrae TaxID=227605 RepID=A0A8B6MAT8_METTU|nr:hypothetical protein MPC4_330002 [Methylocella tundrae]